MFLSQLAKLIFGSKATRAAMTSRYRAVEVIPDGSSCCGAAREISGKRFLSSEVPQLPLPDCDRAICNCGYELFADRRRSHREDRRISTEDAVVGSDNRHSGDRRDADCAA